ncbi:uncharacterized protein LOC106158796 [Lingula anatina]|uniref:Uncharacterized protein LOC106158796 n=1 Tax=Lingula anatina TaxID=7574 RepID=A0A1S3HZ39_LINAN|nr:uncharacterized protein LOC106158796 [Lingula anatina]|eukprot:XP_013390349.1 uncharacterized protein LOC106158796 [Lingula anatina]
MEGGLGSQRYGKIIFLVLTVFSVWSAAQSSKCRGNVCYIEDSSFTDFQSARQRCQSFGGDVVMVDTLEERRLLTEICLRSNYTAPYLLMGATYSSEQWVWFTGEAVNPSVMSWAVGQPEDPSTQPFLCIDSTTGLWHDCASDLQGVLCETPSFCPRLGCCPGVNSTCRVNIPGHGGCYCDEYCLRANDCCEDYVDTCVVIDECFAYTTVTGEISRSSMYHKNSVEAVACDDKIDHGWLRFDMITGNDMPVTCHFEGDCGTDNPIWLNGSLPSAADGVINRTACVKNSTVCCAKTYDIQIKNCSTYNVYHLPPVTQCPERYCIGDKALCPPGTVSENGFEPGCSDNFPNITQQPDIQVDERVVRYTFGNIPKKELMFTCLPYYDEVPPERLSQLVFDVEWYIDSQLVHEEDSVNVTDLPAQLRESVWLSKSITLGFQVKCRVKGKYVQDGQQVGARSLAVESPEFFAGIKVLNSSDFPIRMKENDPNPAIIAFQPTVPILCTDSPSHGLFCKDIFLQVEVRIPQQWKQALCPSEGGVSQIQQVVVEACGIEINAKYWNKTVTLKIAPVIDGIYDGNQITKVLLSTAEFNDHQAWSNYRLPDIPVLVVDADIALQGHVCMANSDPHMVTFDGVTDFKETTHFKEIQLAYCLETHRSTSSCECYPGFVSSDCSISRDTIPDLFYMPTNGLCDISQRPCLETPVYGGPFVQSSNLSCKTEHLTASDVITEYNEAEFVHEEEVICPFPKLRQKRSDISSEEVIKIYNISISNSGTNYSHPLKVAVYDSKCYKCDGPSQCQLKNGTCSINGKCFNKEEQNPSDACQICNPNVTTSDWYLRPNTCTIDNQCYTDGQERTGSFCHVCSSDKNRNSWDIKNGTCRIEEMCYKENDTNPDDPCKICIPSWNKTAWYTQNSACRINGTCYHEGDAQEGNSCKVCNPAVNITDWVLLNETCFVNYTCYNNSDRNPTEPCQLCDPKYSTEAWFDLNGTCSINGSCYNETQQNPARPCQICDPVVSITQWTDLSENCEIEGICIGNLESRRSHVCHVCSSSNSRTAWTIKNGTCSINGSCYNETQQNPARPCQICDPRVSNTQWTDLNENCENEGICIGNLESRRGHVCHVCSSSNSRTAWTIKNGTCRINGSCYNETQQNPARPCQICDPNVSNTEWTDLNETCELDGKCLGNLESRDGHVCHICSPSTSRTSWTIKNGTCSINDSCYNETQQNPEKPCQICDPSISLTMWIILNTDVLRGDRYISNPTAIGRDNQGYQSSTERYDRGSKYQQNNRHQPAYKIGRQIYIPPPDY